MTGPDLSGSTAVPTGTAPTGDVGQRGVGELVREVAQDLTKLFNQEVELAKAEIKIEAKKAGKTAGAFGGAGLAGYFAVLFASLTLMFALAAWWDSLAWPALAVTVLWGIAAALLFLRARKEAQTINPVPETTVQTLKEDAQWAKTRSS
jgi:hypothetical protein